SKIGIEGYSKPLPSPTKEEATMKRRRKEKRRQLRTISLWNYPQAHKALPYLRSVTQSLRDHWLDAQRKRLEVERLSQRHGRPDRSAILCVPTASDAKPQAEPRFRDGLRALVCMRVSLLAPVRVVAWSSLRKAAEL